MRLRMQTADLALRLRQLRLLYGMTQQEVAQHLGVDRSTYSYYETGRNNPPLPTLSALCSLYRVSSEELLRETPGESIRAALLTPTEWQMLRAYRCYAARPRAPRGKKPARSK